MKVDTDIDIDVADHAAALRGLPHISAVIMQDDHRTRHNSGVYFQDIPVDPLDGWAVYDHQRAGDYGYFKIDVLNRGLYRAVRDEAHLDALVQTEPDWDMLLMPEIVATLDHVADHGDILASVRPRSVLDLAVAIALIRPGKRHLLGRSRAAIDAEIWLPTERYYFKKSHSVAYALSIVVQMNLLCEDI